MLFQEPSPDVGEGAARPFNALDPFEQGYGREAPSERPALPRPLLHPHVTSETGRLREVVVGHPYNFDLPPTPERLINERVRDTAAHGRLPSRERMVAEAEALREACEARGVVTHMVEPLGEKAMQNYPRDIGFVIGEDLVVARLATPARQGETSGLRAVLDLVPSDRIVLPPPGLTIEGGDVIVDGKTVYVGLSQRTTASAVEFLRERFPNFEVVGVHLAPPSPGKEALHLDCAFMPVGNALALVWRDGLADAPERFVRGKRSFLEVTEEEGRGLATNVLSLAPDLVVSRHSAKRINRELEARGIEVVTLDFDGHCSLGGSFRCATLPLVRD